ncbi:low molecular weight protein-tyrosine-phosphatase [Brucellaceae bacterium C25G]
MDKEIMLKKTPHSILFICLGNICRSPLSEGVMRDVWNKSGRSETIHFDSAGTNGYHTGEAPDPRSIKVAKQHGIDISSQRCRQLVRDDFYQFDLILGMDQVNITTIAQRKPEDATAHIGLFTEVAGMGAVAIPDPYYGDLSDFEAVYRIVLSSSNALVSSI